MVIELLVGQIAGSPRPARRAALRARARRPRLDRTGARRRLTARPARRRPDAPPMPSRIARPARLDDRVSTSVTLNSGCQVLALIRRCATLPPTASTLPRRVESRSSRRKRDAVTDRSSPSPPLHAPASPPRRRRAPRSDDPAGGGAPSSTRSTSAASPTRNGDGTGDLAGVRSRLPYLRDLGVDAIWFTPWYVSPLADGGYDVADYRAIDPAFGTLEEAEALIAEALALGIRTIIDVVPNHVSDQHPWFQAALAAGPGSPERERFWFRPGPRPRTATRCRPTGASNFAGPTWTRTTERGRHARRVVPPPVHGRAAGPQLGPPRRPRASTRTILRFWFDRGVGRRPDRLGGAAGQGPARCPRCPGRPGAGRAPARRPRRAPRHLSQLARGRRLLPGHRVLVGEVWLPDIDRFARYLRPDELHTAFNFDFMARPWDAGEPARSRSTRPSPRTRRSARRRPGCSPTTT